MKTNGFRKVIALLVNMILVVSLAACSGSNTNNTNNTASTSSNPKQTEAPSTATEASATPVAMDPVKLKIFAAWLIDPLNNSVPNDPVMQEITKKTGVTLDFEPYTGGGDHNAKLSVLLASNELPDIIITDNTSMVNKLITTKQVLPLDDLLKSNGPDILSNFQDSLDEIKAIYPNEDNKLYFMKAQYNGFESDLTHHANMWNLRWDLYKKLGKPKVYTLDEFLSVLKQMQQLEPNNKDGKKNYGMGLNLGDPWGIWIASKGTMNAQGMEDITLPFSMLDLNKNEIVPAFQDTNSKMWDVMKFYNKAYLEGILDPESVTMKFANFTDKATAGRYMSVQAGWLGAQGAEETFAKEGTPDKGYVGIPVWMSSGNTYLTPKNTIGSQFYMMISAKSEHPDRAMDLLNYLATYQALESITNGPEGIGWDRVDGKPVLKPEILKLSKENPAKYKATTGAGIWGNLPLNGSVFEPDGKTRTNFFNEPEVMGTGYKPFQQDFLKDMGYTYPTEGLDNIPNSTFTKALVSSITPDVGSDVATKLANINTYIATAAPAVIFSKSDTEYEKNKVKLINELKKMGVDDVFKFYYDKYEQIKNK